MPYQEATTPASSSSGGKGKGSGSGKSSGKGSGSGKDSAGHKVIQKKHHGGGQSKEYHDDGGSGAGGGGGKTGAKPAGSDPSITTAKPNLKKTGLGATTKGSGGKGTPKGKGGSSKGGNRRNIFNRVLTRPSDADDRANSLIDRTVSMRDLGPPPTTSPRPGNENYKNNRRQEEREEMAEYEDYHDHPDGEKAIFDAFIILNDE